MKFMQIMSATVLTVIGVSLTACGEKKEPPLPTFDPQTKVKAGPEGYGVSGTIAIDSQNNFYHTEHLVTNYYNFDATLPAASITPVKPSCSAPKAAPNDNVHVIISRGGGGGRKLLGEIEQPTLMTFSNAEVEDLAKKRADIYIKTQTFKAVGKSFANWTRPMSHKNIIITESTNPVYLVLVGRWPTLYNVTVAPYAKVSGVMVYSDELGAAVAGLDPSVPVHFQSGEAPETKRCWVRTENKPDETWTGHKKAMRVSASGRKNSRYHLLKAIYEKFAMKIRRDVGSFSNSDLIGLGGGSYFLVGPAPTQFEQRIPYSPVSGSHIKFMATDNVEYGMHQDLKKIADDVLHSRTKKILAGEP